jgi:hypothetical protein
MSKCKYCLQHVNPRKDHDCPVAEETFSSNDGDFLLSLAIGAATDSALLGGLIGGDIFGGLLGDGLDGDLLD